MSVSHCPNYISCADVDCRLHHYHNFNPLQRIKVASLINEVADEMFLHIETEKTSSTPCYFGLLCFHTHTDCGLSHSGVSLSGRKILIKKVKQMEKATKKK